MMIRNLFAVLPYFFPYLITAFTILGLRAGGFWSFSGFLFIFFVHPLLDYIFRRKAVSTHRPDHYWSLAPVVISLPVLIFSLVYGGIRIQMASLIEFVGITLSVGAIGGVLGINMAHELIHRKNDFLKIIGYLNLIALNFSHWGIEHVYGHHKNVATYEDPATARKNESVYSFWFRNYFQGLVDAYKIESSRGLLKNRVILYSSIQVLIGIILAVLSHWQILLFWYLTSIVSWLLLMTVDYIEHYGLQRTRNQNNIYERVQPKHSWDSSAAFTNWALINLGHHAHHHFSASVPYQELEIQSKASHLPFGYSSMILISLCPPLFYEVMNPLLESKSAGN